MVIIGTKRFFMHSFIFFILRFSQFLRIFRLFKKKCYKFLNEKSTKASNKLKKIFIYSIYVKILTITNR